MKNFKKLLAVAFTLAVVVTCFMASSIMASAASGTSTPKQKCSVSGCECPYLTLTATGSATCTCGHSTTSHNGGVAYPMVTNVSCDAVSTMLESYGEKCGCTTYLDMRDDCSAGYCAYCGHMNVYHLKQTAPSHSHSYGGVVSFLNQPVTISAYADTTGMSCSWGGCSCSNYAGTKSYMCAKCGHAAYYHNGVFGGGEETHSHSYGGVVSQLGSSLMEPITVTAYASEIRPGLEPIYDGHEQELCTTCGLIYTTLGHSCNGVLKRDPCRCRACGSTTCKLCILEPGSGFCANCGCSVLTHSRLNAGSSGEEPPKETHSHSYGGVVWGDL